MNINKFIEKLTGYMEGLLTNDCYINKVNGKNGYEIYSNMSAFFFNVLIDLYNSSASENDQIRYINLILTKNTLEGMFISVKSIEGGYPIKVVFVEE